MKEWTVPETCLLGVATAGAQYEGHNPACNWIHWGREGRIDDYTQPEVLVDHYHRQAEDLELVKALGAQVYRLSIEWSRVEPERGKFSQEGIDFYRRELEGLRALGVVPMVTLHHFAHPQWFEEMGQWTREESVELFCIYVQKVLDELGHLIDEWIPINEPNVFVNDTFMDGKYPPGAKNDVMNYFKAGKNLVLAHQKAYAMIHKHRTVNGFTGTKVGTAIHVAYFVAPEDFFGEATRAFMNYAFHDLFFRGMVEGVLSFPWGFLGEKTDEAKCADFLGINYYSRHFIVRSMNPATLFGKETFREGMQDHEMSDLGWEIYPQGLTEICRKYYERYKLPIVISENGIADRADVKRMDFIRNHLKEVVRLTQEGIEVTRYCHWTFLDNLEWNEGFGPKFGLIAVDGKTLDREPRESFYRYAEICKTHRFEG